VVALGVFFGLVFTVGTALAAFLSVKATRDRVSPPHTSDSSGGDLEKST